eukprot:359416-Chlamydomonas_euryale.AAC.9
MHQSLVQHAPISPISCRSVRARTIRATRLRAELRDDAFRPCAGKVEGPRRIGDVSKVHHHLVQQHAVSPLVQVRLRSQLHVECLQQIEVDCHVRGHHSFHDQLAHLKSGQEGGGDSESRVRNAPTTTGRSPSHATLRRATVP